MRFLDGGLIDPIFLQPVRLFARDGILGLASASVDLHVSGNTTQQVTVALNARGVFAVEYFVGVGNGGSRQCFPDALADGARGQSR